VTGARRPPFARKRFGQHFLERAWIEQVIKAIDPRPDQLFIEIGPGRGALTRPLAARASRVIAYEIDRDLAAQLRAQAIPNVTIVEGDFLDADVGPPVLEGEVRGSGDRGAVDGANGQHRLPALRVAGNLPYNVASPILFRLAELYAAGVPIVDATVMLQREVADRVAATPGSRDYGVLTVLTQHVADAEIVLTLPPGAFRPVPKVHSAVVRLRFHPPDPPVADPAKFAEVVQAVFMHRRKTLENALKWYEGGRRSAAGGGARPGSEVGNRGGAIDRGERGRRSTRADSADSGSEVDLEATDRNRPPTPLPPLPPIDPRRRPETLTVAEFARLADWIKTRS
jgi:16S rRNA (adenine1518-N6/adenine1519-N6)-dimethyltransferase